MGYVTRPPLLSLLFWYPTILEKLLQLIWRSGTHRFEQVKWYQFNNPSNCHLICINLSPAWISNHMPCKMWYDITGPFSYFNHAPFEVWELISNFIPHLTITVITNPCWNWSSFMLVKGAPGKHATLLSGLFLLKILFFVHFWFQHLAIGSSSIFNDQLAEGGCGLRLHASKIDENQFA